MRDLHSNGEGNGKITPSDMRY